MCRQCMLFAPDGAPYVAYFLVHSAAIRSCCSLQWRVQCLSVALGILVMYSHGILPSRIAPPTRRTRKRHTRPPKRCRSSKGPASKGPSRCAAWRVTTCRVDTGVRCWPSTGRLGWRLLVTSRWTGEPWRWLMPGSSCLCARNGVVSVWRGGPLDGVLFLSDWGQQGRRYAS